MVQLDRVPSVPSELLKHLRCDLQNLRVRDHGIEIGSRDIEIALVELPHPSLRNGRLISPVHLGDVVPLHAADVRVHGEPPREGDGQVVAERAQLAALVLEVVDELRVLAVLAREDLAQLEDGRVERRRAMALEDLRDGVEDAVAEKDVRAGPVLGPLRGLEIEGRLLLGHRVYLMMIVVVGEAATVGDGGVIGIESCLAEGRSDCTGRAPVAVEGSDDSGTASNCSS